MLLCLKNGKLDPKPWWLWTTRRYQQPPSRSGYLRTSLVRRNRRISASTCLLLGLRNAELGSFVCRYELWSDRWLFSCLCLFLRQSNSFGSTEQHHKDDAKAWSSWPPLDRFLTLVQRTFTSPVTRPSFLSISRMHTLYNQLCPIQSHHRHAVRYPLRLVNS